MTNTSSTLVLQNNNGTDGHHRVEARLTDGGLVLASSQRASIDLQFGRAGYDYHAFNLTTEQMERLVGWWGEIQNGGKTDG